MSYVSYFEDLHVGDMVRWNKNIKDNWRKFKCSGWWDEPLDCILTVDKIISSSNSNSWLAELSCSMNCGCHEVLTISHSEYTKWGTALGEPLLLWAGMCDLVVASEQELASKKQEYDFETDCQYIIGLIQLGTLDDKR